MDAIKVVEAQVGVELAAQAREAHVEVAGEGRAPALVEDRALQRLDVADGIRRIRFRYTAATRRRSGQQRLGTHAGVSNGP